MDEIPVALNHALPKSALFSQMKKALRMFVYFFLLNAEIEQVPMIDKRTLHLFITTTV